MTAAYERGLDKLQRWWKEFGSEATWRWNEFINSGMVQDMEKGFNGIGQRLGQGDTALYMLQSMT